MPGEPERGRDERELLEGLKEGDDSAYRELIRRYGAMVMEELRCEYPALTREDREDIFAEVLFQLITHIEQYQQSRAILRTWLMAIARHAAIDLLRKRTRSPRVESSDIERIGACDQDPDPPDEADVSPRIEAIREIVDTLSADERRILEAGIKGARAWSKDLARELGVNDGTIRQRFHRIKNRIKRQLELLDIRTTP